MSGAKRLIEEMADKRRKARTIAHKAGVLTVCEYHDAVFKSGKDVVEAYKLGEARFEMDSLGETFDNRREMTDYIKEVAQDANFECPVCTTIRYS
ncbi:MAG: hypothetical protein ACLP3R_24935 [Candidatus Korobacteraceae bacterium]